MGDHNTTLTERPVCPSCGAADNEVLISCTTVCDRCGALFDAEKVEVWNTVETKE